MAETVEHEHHLRMDEVRHKGLYFSGTERGRYFHPVPIINPYFARSFRIYPEGVFRGNLVQIGVVLSGNMGMNSATPCNQPEVTLRGGRYGFILGKGRVPCIL